MQQTKAEGCEREQIELLHSHPSAVLSPDPFLRHLASWQNQGKLKCSLTFSFQSLPSILSADTKLQPAPPEVFHKHRRDKSAEQSNRDKWKQLNFFTYFSAPRVPALKSMDLFRANTGINDEKLFKVNVF